ncbi:hypothetical protein [Pseudonocardia alaniniphila]|uniref:Uncharacterized protein n=1 Tax=Pseudonocardia alaniniphila TaxID=75291 RepID=A0ABS9TUT5_9PSEU|nr:hypothetical protein [Pseudonocardia alaniniphila]MCH6172317.1 hypothetical protein [Pseudonocardia alaniniphila]
MSVQLPTLDMTDLSSAREQPRRLPARLEPYEPRPKMAISEVVVRGAVGCRIGPGHHYPAAPDDSFATLRAVLHMVQMSDKRFLNLHESHFIAEKDYIGVWPC